MADDRLEIAGHWSGVRGRRFVRPVLWLHEGGGRRRLVAVLDHKPWAAQDGDPWVAAFPWDGGPFEPERAELEVGSDLVVELPVPGGPKPPSELVRTRAELAEAQDEAERARKEAAATAARAAEEVERLRGERDQAREDAERARADGERLVNDEWQQRQRALQAAEEAATRAREADAARALAERQLSAARAAHARLEEQLAAVEAERARLGAADAEQERLRLQLAATEAERARLERELAASETERIEREAAPPPPARVVVTGRRSAVAPVAEPPVRVAPLLEPAGVAPRSRVGLWLLRLIAIAFVIALLAGVALVLSDAL